MAFIVKSDEVNIDNGDKKEIHVSIDSRRNKNQQVQASITENGKKYAMEDPLTKFIQKLNKNHDSIFELLKKEKKESLMVHDRGHVEKVDDEPPVYDRARVQKVQKVQKVDDLPMKKGKRDKGISKKIFDYDYDLPVKHTRKKKRKKQSKKRSILKK